MNVCAFDSMIGMATQKQADWQAAKTYFNSFKFIKTVIK